MAWPLAWLLFQNLQHQNVHFYNFLMIVWSSKPKDTNFHPNFLAHLLGQLFFGLKMTRTERIPHLWNRPIDCSLKTLIGFSYDKNAIFFHCYDLLRCVIMDESLKMIQFISCFRSLIKLLSDLHLSQGFFSPCWWKFSFVHSIIVFTHWFR